MMPQLTESRRAGPEAAGLMNSLSTLWLLSCVSAASAQYILPSYDHSNGRADRLTLTQANVDAITVSARTPAEVNKHLMKREALWKPQAERYEEWVCELACALLQCTSAPALRELRRIVRWKAGLAELVLPYIFVDLACES